jgi:hypothetical protein
MPERTDQEREPRLVRLGVAPAARAVWERVLVQLVQLVVVEGEGEEEAPPPQMRQGDMWTSVC